MSNDEFLDNEKLSRNFYRDAQIIEMIEKGLSYAEIGRTLNLTRARVSQIAIEHGYVVRPSLVNLEKRKS